jgi:hypothetical protein
MNKTDDNLYVDLIAWLKLAVETPSFKIIEGNQRGAVPTGSYATILVINSSSVGMAGELQEFVEGLDNPAPDGAFGVATSSLREVTVSLQFYRDGAHENMRKVMHFLATNTSKEFLFEKGISIFIPSSYNNLDDIEGDGAISRSQMDLRIHCASEFVETVNAIDDVQLSIQS